MKNDKLIKEYTELKFNWSFRSSKIIPIFYRHEIHKRSFSVFQKCVSRKILETIILIIMQIDMKWEHHILLRIR